MVQLDCTWEDQSCPLVDIVVVAMSHVGAS